MDNSLCAHLPVLIQIAIGVALPVLILVASHLFGQRASANAAKNSPYECGVPAAQNSPFRPRFVVRFQVAAMLFILFDVEVVFLIPWALSFRELLAQHIAIAVPSAVFISVISLGLLYEIRKGALDWDTPKSKLPPLCE
ncbi:MAG: NADH-quinone oxidoreductase subunit A [Puniceicoccales bacterium]|jgi:NADH-quinone oxidoreductase subunit A|nr:NADH-quinone oxidoreductase subunit A [Puniceicoccales bacterium]